MNEVKAVLVTHPEQFSQCQEIRRKVFIDEQGVPESIEIDSYEKESKHFLVLLDGRPVGTGRMRLKKSYIKFERIATLQNLRGKGIGRALMEEMHNYARKNFHEYLPAMHAQQDAIGFYERMGWVAMGEIFYEAEIPHQLLFLPPEQKASIQKLKLWTDSDARDDIRTYLSKI